MPTSGTRSLLEYWTRGPSVRSWAAMRNPSASNATPSVICQLAIDGNRRPSRSRPDPGSGAVAAEDHRDDADRPRGEQGTGDHGRAIEVVPSVDAAPARPGAAVGPGVTTGAPGCPAQPSGSGPAGAGCGPTAVGAVVPRSLSQPAWNAAMSWPIPAWKASSSVTPSAYERTSLTRASLPNVRMRKSTADTLSP